MPYFRIMQGLRGCYMPDNAYVLRADTRRELKSALEYEFCDLVDAGAVGLSKRALASLAARAWRSPSVYDCVAPYRWRYQSPGRAPYGVFVSRSTRREYLDQEEA